MMLEVDPTNDEQLAAWDGGEGAYWAAHADHFDRSLARYQPAFLAAAEVAPGHRVLDVGCGAGETTLAAARLGAADALGVDLSSEMLAVARARADAAAGRITPAERRAIEDRAIAAVVKMQEDVGLRSATDGEFRRATWHMDFIYQLGGVRPGDERLRVAFHNEAGELSFETPALVVDARISLPEPIFAADFGFLASTVTTATPKLTIPSPSMVHYRGGRAALDPAVYPIEDDQELVIELLRAKKILVTHGTGFNWPDTDHFRLVTLPEASVLEEAIGRIADFLATRR